MAFSTYRLLAAAGIVICLAPMANAQPAEKQSAPSPSLASLNPILGDKLVNAKPGQLRIFVTAAFLKPLEAVRKQAEAAVGKPVFIQYGSARGDLRTDILAGQGFDIAILTPDVLHEVGIRRKTGTVEYDIANLPVGIALRGDAPAPDVSTPEALRTALLKAAAVKYAPTGAARNTVNNVLSTLDVAGKIKDVSATPANVPLAPGEYEISFYPISEILMNNRLKNLGLVPDSLQVPVQIVAVTSRDGDLKTARKFLDFLQGPAITSELAASGMVRPQ